MKLKWWQMVRNGMQSMHRTINYICKMSEKMKKEVIHVIRRRIKDCGRWLWVRNTYVSLLFVAWSSYSSTVATWSIHWRIFFSKVCTINALSHSLHLEVCKKIKIKRSILLKRVLQSAALKLFLVNYHQPLHFNITKVMWLCLSVLSPSAIHSSASYLADCNYLPQ